MDKYEFNIKVEQIKKLVNKGDYVTAMKIADTIDWRRVHNANLLTLVAQIYEKNEDYQEAKDILLLAFERAPVGKRLLYKLSELSLKEQNIEEAEDYYKEFAELASEDPRQHLLRYMILKAKHVPLDQLINALERYLLLELEEKWLYELATLYHQAGQGDKCIEICDKIMLMFGLGKYVDKAMDLKIQYAPLTSYQMDLVENRDKYEAKLRAVEQAYSHAPEPEAAADIEETRETESVKEPVPANHYEETGETARPIEPHMTEEPIEVREPYTKEEPIRKRETYMEEESMGKRAPYMTEEPNQMEELYQREEPYGMKEPAAAPSVSYRRLDEELISSMQRTETEEHLARELSRMTMDEPEYMDAPADRTRVIGTIREAVSLAANSSAAAAPSIITKAEPTTPSVTIQTAAEEVYSEVEEPIIEDLDLEKPLEQESKIHVMIEARTPEKGLALAIQMLRELHKQTGSKNGVAKISGEKLNRRGIFSSIDKLRGKDLIIENAGDLSIALAEELKRWMSEDNQSRVVILIDNPRQMAALSRQYPGLTDGFECVRGEETDIQAEEKTEVPERTAVKRPSVSRAVPKEVEVKPKQKPMTAAAKPKQEPVAAAPRPKRKAADTAKPIQPSKLIPSTLGQMLNQEPEQPVENAQDNVEMDIDEFAQYACKFAKSIDCSITGKSMLALYERIEIMEEDGILLTKRNAEELVDEAADRAEKPSFKRLITGIFTSKYDKDDMLILKEEHFIG